MPPHNRRESYRANHLKQSVFTRPGPKGSCDEPARNRRSARSCSRQFRFAKGAGRGSSATGGHLGSAARYWQFTTRLAAHIRHILDNAVRLCRAEEVGGVCRLAEEGGFRLVAHNLTPAVLAQYTPPMLYEHGSPFGRLLASRSPVHIPDVAAELRRAGEDDRMDLSKVGARTGLFVPMLINDEQIGSMAIGRLHIEPFTEKEIELVTDFAAQAAIALEITRRERQLRELQMQLAHTNRVVTVGELSASITHEVNQPIAAGRNNVIAALHFLDVNPPDLREVREALAAAVKDTDRVSAIVGRMRALMQKASPRLDPVDMKEALQEVVELTRGEALKNRVLVETQFAQGLPVVAGDRVQLQQVVLNLIVNAMQAMGTAGEGVRQVLIITRQIELNDLYIGLQ